MFTLKIPHYSGDNYLFGYKIVNEWKIEYYKLDDKKTNFVKVSLMKKIN